MSSGKPSSSSSSTTMTVTDSATTAIETKVLVATNAVSTAPATTGSSSQSKSFSKIVLTLEHCLLPEAKLDLTPSQADGLDREFEIDLRILGCELIQTAGILLKCRRIAETRYELP